MAGVAARSELEPDDAVLRFGLHWGSSAYVEWITTTGRSEVTALGSNANRLTYTRLAELSMATEKARNDAPAIAVCEV